MSDTTTYALYDDASAKARDLALSHEKCEELIRKKSEKLGTEDYRILVDRIVLNVGRREVILTITFPDGEGFQVMVDIDKELVHWIKTLGDFTA